MLSRNMTKNAHCFIEMHLQQWGKKNLIAMDGTLGNGHDLEFLNSQENIGTIYGFDIQKEALENSKKRVSLTQKQIYYIQDSHHHLDHYIKDEIDLAIFNLGYLPGGDKSIVTKVQTTLQAIEKTIIKLSKGGMILIMTYPGHKEGEKEHEAIRQYLSSLRSKHLSVLQLCVNNVASPCPNCFLIISQF